MDDHMAKLQDSIDHEAMCQKVVVMAREIITTRAKLGQPVGEVDWRELSAADMALRLAQERRVILLVSMPGGRQ